MLSKHASRAGRLAWMSLKNAILIGIIGSRNITVLVTKKSSGPPSLTGSLQDHNLVKLSCLSFNTARSSLQQMQNLKLTTMKKFASMLTVSIMAMAFVACDEDEVTPDEPLVNTVVSGVIDQNETWTANKIYELDGRVIVADGATLTIEAGTIIKGQNQTGASASALMIARGGKINAVGTAQKPIIFTSVLDNIELEQTSGTNLTEADKAKWGGLVILGKAPISF